MADPIIKSTIPLTAAMGTTRGMSPSEFVGRWVQWGIKFPKEKAKLNPSIVASMEALTIVVTVQETIETVIATLNTVLATLQDAYNAAMSVVPGVGGANAAKVAAEKAKTLVVVVMDEAVGKLKALPQTIYDILASQVSVDEGAIL